MPGDLTPMVEKNGPHLAMRAGLLRPGTCRGAPLLFVDSVRRAGMGAGPSERLAGGCCAGMAAIVGSRRAWRSAFLFDK
ncbi:hypothetical protein D3C78_1603480 [compost metagenome]